jgi:plasmid stability protein
MLSLHTLIALLQIGVSVVASLTVRNIPDEAKHRFRQVAAAYGRSMEEHLRQLVLAAGSPAELSSGLREVPQPFRHVETNPRLAESRTRIEHLIALGRGVDFEQPPRETGTIKDVDFS